MRTGEDAWRGAFPPGRNPIVDTVARRAEKQREARFLCAWKQGVRRAGLHYFEVAAPHRLELALHRDQLRPNYRVIKSALAGDIDAEGGLFLCALYSFYNEDEGRRLMRRHYPRCRSREQLLALVDAGHRAILETLLGNYTEW